MSYILYANDGGTPVQISSSSAPEYVERIEALEVSQAEQTAQIEINTTNAAQAALDAAEASQEASTALYEVRNITTMVGATEYVDGTGGLTPAPSAGSNDRFLCSDGTWEQVQSSSYSLFDYKWTDHILNESRWLRADTFSWHSGAVYSDCYQELYDEYMNNASVTESNGYFSFKRTPKGYCIAAAEDMTKVADLYDSKGIAWYYILDTVNQQFKLPRTKYGFVGVRTEPGTPVNYNDVDENAILLSSNTAPGSSPYCVQNPATQMYLYAYVGYFSKDAIAQTAGINTGNFVMKADTDLANITSTGKSLVSGLGMPSERRQILSVAASGTIYEAPANGWFVFGGGGTSGTRYISLYNTTVSFAVSGATVSGVNSADLILPVLKGHSVQINFSADTALSLAFIYAEGEEA